MSALLEYECRVPVSGYDVITIELHFTRSEPMKKYRVLQPRSERTKSFDLFDRDPDAYLEFAQTPQTEDAIKAFADRYGLLLPDTPGITMNVGGRFIDTWSIYIGSMRRHVELWEMSKKTGDFSKIIRAVQRTSGREAPRGVTEVDLLLKEDPSSASAKLCIRPSSLNDALWAELLLAIDGKQNLRGCVQCRKWFTLEAGRGRSDKEYCSDACRMRAYRKRKGSR
jgi:hypothetical protein